MESSAGVRWKRPLCRALAIADCAGVLLGVAPKGNCSAWRGMLTGLMVLALLRRPLVKPARAARTAQLCSPLAWRHTLARMSVCTSSEADGDGETAAVLPSVKRSELTEPMKKRVAYQQRYVCLLYTSPSPRDRQKSRMPSSA